MGNWFLLLSIFWFKNLFWINFRLIFYFIGLKISRKFVFWKIYFWVIILPILQVLLGSIAMLIISQLFLKTSCIWFTIPISFSSFLLFLFKSNAGYRENVYKPKDIIKSAFFVNIIFSYRLPIYWPFFCITTLTSSADSSLR